MFLHFIVIHLLIDLKSNVQCLKSVGLKCAVKLDLDVCYSTDIQKVNEVSCYEYEICKRQFNISYVRLEPYSSDIVSDLLRLCCGTCVKTKEINTFLKMSEITAPNISTADLVFPVLGRADINRFYGYHFIPLIETPNIYYITNKEHDLMHDLLLSCVNMWPLLVICLLMIAISGFIGWLMETWVNKEAFPRPFLSGWFEGVWWSFVSMTTVGYGDKVPKSVSARLFSIAWIFIGITTFSLITAMLSAEITQANSPPPPSMEGTRVGAIRYRLYDAILIAKHGGVLVDVNMNNVTEGIHELIVKLKNKEIDGFVLDRYLLLLFYRIFENHIRHSADVTFLKTMTIRTELSYEGKRFSYGILVKNEADYDFLVDFVVDNRDVINTCNGLLLNNYSSELNDEHIQNPLFATSGEVFWPTFCTAMIIVAFICLFGLLYEFHRRHRCFRKKAVPV